MDSLSPIVGILEIVGYGGDKKRFAEQFLSACQSLTLLSLVESISTEKKESFNTKVKEIQTDTTSLTEFLLSEFGREGVERAFREVLTREISNMFGEMIATLPAEKKQQLEEYAKKLELPA